MVPDAELEGETGEVYPRRRGSAERRLDRRRAVHELGRRREQLDRRAPRGKLAQRQHALDGGDAGTGHQHVRHGAAASTLAAR